MKLVLHRYPENDDELHEFVWTVWGANIPRASVCPGHHAPFDAFAEAFFARTPVSVWKASRGFGGKSHTLSMLCNTEAVCLAAQITVLGGSSSQSLAINEAAQTAWEHPLSPKGQLAKATMYRTSLRNTAWIKSLTASQRSARGPHPQRLRLDEIDEMDMSILEAAQGQPMSKIRNGKRVETQTVMSSTHQYPDGTMSKILKRADELGWPVHHWCYRESMGNPAGTGWLRPEEVERKKTEIPRHMWDTEYELQEPSFVGRIFSLDDVNYMFDPNEGRKAGKMGEDIIIEPYDARATYVTGIDWAKESDWTVISTWRTDCAPWRRVAWIRLGRMSWPAIIAKANQRLRQYYGVLCHDSTGIGTVIADFLNNPSSKTIDLSMVGAARVDLFNDFISAVENHSFTGPMIDYAYSELKYTTLDDLFTSKGHPPDSFVADSLAWRGRSLIFSVLGPMSVMRDSSNRSLAS